MIQSFKCKKTESLVAGHYVKDFEAFREAAERKLQMLDSAADLRDLGSPPGNRPEPLQGNRKGQHSIRINKQYRICFHWTAQGPHDVEITDYHP